MNLKIDVKDRVPTYPGRIKLTPVSGQENVFDMERADLPLEPGTPVNKVLFDSKVDGLTADVTVYVSRNGNDVNGTGEIGLPFATIQKAVDAIPKFLNGHTVTINIADGIYNEKVVCKGFAGGKLIIGTNSSDPYVTAIEIDGCSDVELNVARFQVGSATGSELLKVTNGSNVFIPFITTFNGSGGNVTGILASHGGLVCFALNTNIAVNSCSTAAVVATMGGQVVLCDVTGSDNQFGLVATMGGTITLRNTTISSSWGDNAESGGRIIEG